MRKLNQIDRFGALYFRWNVAATQGYRGGESNTIAQAPLIHTYSTTMETLSSRLVLRQIEPAITMNNHPFRVSRFLTVQPMTPSFFKDEDGAFRPSVKPHYAISGQNGAGTIYDENCPIALYTKDALIFSGKQNVHIHDTLCSPASVIPGLGDQLINAHRQGRDAHFTSYVIDNVHQHIVITEHALLSEKSHQALIDALERMPEPNIETLVALENNPISEALTRFDSPNWQMDQHRLRSLSPSDVFHIAPELLVLPQDQFDHIMDKLHQNMKELIAKHPEFSIRNNGLEKTVLESLVDGLTEAGRVLINTPIPNAFKAWFRMHDNIELIASEAEKNSPLHDLTPILQPMFEWVSIRIDTAAAAVAPPPPAPVALKYNPTYSFFSTSANEPKATHDTEPPAPKS